MTGLPALSTRARWRRLMLLRFDPLNRRAPSCARSATRRRSAGVKAAPRRGRALGWRDGCASELPESGRRVKAALGRGRAPGWPDAVAPARASSRCVLASPPRCRGDLVNAGGCRVNLSLTFRHQCAWLDGPCDPGNLCSCGRAVTRGGLPDLDAERDQRLVGVAGQIMPDVGTGGLFTPDRRHRWRCHAPRGSRCRARDRRGRRLGERACGTPPKSRAKIQHSGLRSGWCDAMRLQRDDFVSDLRPTLGRACRPGVVRAPRPCARRRPVPDPELWRAGCEEALDLPPQPRSDHRRRAARPGTRRSVTPGRGG